MSQRTGGGKEVLTTAGEPRLGGTAPTSAQLRDNVAGMLLVLAAVLPFHQ